MRLKTCKYCLSQGVTNRDAGLYSCVSDGLTKRDVLVNTIKLHLNSDGHETQSLYNDHSNSVSTNNYFST